MVRKARQPDLVDLHVHSTASDGLYTPRGVVEHAALVGLKAIALTDHDTVAGLPEALAAGKEFAVEVIPGVEISSEIDIGACHILGYFLDYANPALVETLEEAREGRQVRNREILQRLNRLGFRLSMEDVIGQSTDGTITRAHFAAAMLAKKMVKSWDEAFEKYLGHGKPAFVGRKKVGPWEAIEVIHAAGGLAVAAHPRQLASNPDEADQWFGRLVAKGLDGIETRTPDHDLGLARRYHAAAVRLGLVETGGTDWHGRPDAGIHLGLGRGGMKIRYSLVEAMKERLATR